MSLIFFSMKRTEEEILRELGVEEEVLAIFPYGSKVYGCDTSKSDEDYIIVTKNAFLKSGGFKQNAISNADYTIQGTLYSRTGFIDAINNYDIIALECLFLDDKQVIKKKWPFKIQKWDEKEMVKKIIQKASASWHIADKQAKGGFKDRAKKGIYHALRILKFGLQLKEDQKITDYGACNALKFKFASIKPEEFDTRDYIKERDEIIEKLRTYDNEE